MDHEQFAALTRLIAARGSRRGALLALLGAALFGRTDFLNDGGGGAEAKKSGGRDGGKRHGRNRGNGRHRPGRDKGHRREKKQKEKAKEKATCAGLGEEPQPEEPCCPELVLDGAGRCAEPATPSCAETCDGCCDGESCITITEVSDEACGANGSPCGTCAVGETCGRCEPGICGVPNNCTPLSCLNMGVDCGPQSNGCGGVIECGDCTAPQICGGGGVPSVCGGGGGGPTPPPPPTCTPRTTCVPEECGQVANGCGGLLNCGSCPAGQVCFRDHCVSAC